MAWRKSPKHMIDLFDEVIPKDSQIVRRKMIGYPAAFLNGHLFADLHQEDFILKLSPADREKLRKERDARVFEPMPGRAMREYLVLPEVVLAKDRRYMSAPCHPSRARPGSSRVWTPRPHLGGSVREIWSGMATASVAMY